MKQLALLLPLLLLTNCKPEQTATEFEITVKPQAGKNVEASTPEDQPVLVSYSVEDEEGMDNLSFDLVEQPKYGQLTDCKYITKKDWQCIYTPYKDFNGEDSLVFKTKNGDFHSNDASKLTIKVLPSPDRPIAGANQKFTLMENTQKSFTISGVSDPDTATKDLIFEIKTAPVNGELVNCFEKANPLSCTYIPTKEYFGEDYFEYSVTDEETKDLDQKSSARVSFQVMREWVSISGVSEIKIEDKASNALIVFAIDNSGSMEPYINHMKQSVANFIDDVASRGFQATIAFITSDQVSSVDYKDVKTTQKPHPDYPDRSDSWLELIKRVPTDGAVKIFEINAYDIEWNEATKEKISLTKSNIEDFLTNLPKGTDDERLLCSTLRFLHSDHVENKDFVGVFTLANEDDAADARTLDKAFTDCLKEQKKERKPIASCNQTVECSEDDPECSGKFTYTYDEIIPRPYPAVYQGKCKESEPNMVTVTKDKRKYKLKEIEAVYKKILDEDNSEKEYTRVKVVNNPKTVNSRGKKALPTTTKRSGKKEVPVISYRQGLKEKETTTVRSYDKELDKINKRRGSQEVSKTNIRSGRKWKSQYTMRKGQINLPKTAMRKGQIIIDKTEYKRIIRKLPIVDARAGKKIVASSANSMEHCHDDWKTRDNLLGCQTVFYDQVSEKGTCPTLPSTSWIDCSDFKVSIKNGSFLQIPKVGYIEADEVDEVGSCSSESDYVSCQTIYKAKINNILTEFEKDELALQDVAGETGSCPAGQSNWHSCTNYWTVNVEGETQILENESENVAANFDEKGACSAKSDAISCSEYKAVKISGSYIDITTLDVSQITNNQNRQNGTCPSEIPNATWESCLQEYKAVVDGVSKYTQNSEEIFLQDFNEKGLCNELQESSSCEDYQVVMIDGSEYELKNGETKTTPVTNEVGECSNDLLNCTSFAAIQINGNWKAFSIASDEEKHTSVEELGTCSEGDLKECKDILKATINGKLQVVESAPAYQDMELESGLCSSVEWAECEESYYVMNQDGSETKISKGQIVSYDDEVIGQACPSENAGWIECETFYTVINLEGKKIEVGKDEETQLRIEESGMCDDLEEDSYISCSDSWEYSNLVYIQELDYYQETGKISELIDEEGKCEELPEDKVKWLSGSCENYQGQTKEQDGYKYTEVDCTHEGGSSCSDHADYFVSGTCSLKSAAGNHDPIINENLTLELPTRKSCLEATGANECKIAWSGEKQIKTDQGCELSTSKRVTQYFEPEDGKDRTLANGLVNALKNNFTKAVYVGVINDFDLNNAAVALASSNKDLELPTSVCTKEYYEAREAYKSTRDGETWYEMDGGEFKKVVEALSEQGAVYSICSPTKYPSDKLDYLVADAKLNYKIKEYDEVDNLSVSGVKIIYASGESKILSSKEYTYSKGAISIVDPLDAKNVIEVHINYSGYEK